MTFPARHTETTVIPGRRLGWKPRDPSRAVLKLGNYLTGTIPDHPTSVDYFTRISTWLLGRNGEFGTCGPVSLANSLLLVSTWLADAPIRVTDDDIFDLYRRSGNPDFDPATGADDNGVDMSVMLAAALKEGIGGYKPLAFAEVNGENPAEVWAAGALFGGMLWGADLTVAQQRQADLGLWDYAPSRTWGGHAIMAAGKYTDQPGTVQDRTGLVSWAKAINATDTFMAQQVHERYVVIWPWHLGSKSFLTGVDMTALAADYRALTGRAFPTPTPIPVPSPVPVAPSTTSAADQALAAAVPATWLAHPHLQFQSTSTVASALETWLAVKGLKPTAS